MTIKVILPLAAAVLAAVPCITAAAYADTSAGACLINAVTGETVFEKNIYEKLPMASTTKIMTLLTALENSEPDEQVTVSVNAAGQEGSSAYIEAGAVISMNDLSYGLMLNSGNDAAVAIAEHVSGSAEAFAEKMNSLAGEIGLKDTEFKNPNGLNAEGHYTTARDLAVLTRYALKNEEFAQIVSTRSYTAHQTLKDGTVKEVEYINHNKLLGAYEGCIGVKTGYTEAAGRCLVSAAERGGAVYIAVTLNSKNDWAEHKAMLDHGFETARTVTAVEKGECVRHIVSESGACELVAADSFEIPVNSKKGTDVTVRIDISDMIAPPLNKGEKVGILEIYSGDELLGTVDAVAASDLSLEGGYKAKPCFFTAMIRIIKSILG